MTTNTTPGLLSIQAHHCRVRREGFLRFLPSSAAADETTTTTMPTISIGRAGRSEFRKLLMASAAYPESLHLLELFLELGLIFLLLFLEFDTDALLAAPRDVMDLPTGQRSLVV